MTNTSPFTLLLKDRINLTQIPFTDCGSRLLVYENDGLFSIHLARQPLDLAASPLDTASHLALIEQGAFTDENGVPMETHITTYPHHLLCHTGLGDFILAFQDNEALLLTPPPGTWGVSFHVRAEKAHTDSRGSVMHINGHVQHDLAYTTNAHILRNQIEPQPDGSQRVSLVARSEPGDSLLLHISARMEERHYLPDPDEALQAAEKRWHNWFSAVPYVDGPLQAQYYYAWWVLRAGNAAAATLSISEPASAALANDPPVSDWDTYFQALAYRHVDPRLAQLQLRTLVEQQLPDGMLPARRPATAAAQTDPMPHLPLVTWTAWKLYSTTHDRSFLARLYPALVRWNRWWFEHSDCNCNGLCEYPLPPGAQDEDQALATFLETPDLNTYIFLQQESLGRMAGELGYYEQAQHWNRRAQKTLQRMLELLWDEQAGFFWPRLAAPDGEAGPALQIRTPLNLFPLLTGQLPQEVSRRLVANLTDPHQFWTRYPVPSIALNDPRFDREQSWPGATLAQVNYLLVEGLSRSGFHGLARELRYRTLERLAMPSGLAGAQYSPESAAIFIDLAIQERYERSKLRSNSTSPMMRRAAV